MLIQRNLEKELISMALHYPVVTITGPRQSGKTTLTRQTFKEKPYANLEQPDVLAFAKEDPRGFLGQYPDGVILDEVQKCPDLLSYIQVIVDEKDQKGQFILTGSEHLLLSEKVSQSLAGRTALLNLLPFSLQELSPHQNLSLDNLLLTGFYPRIYKDNLNPTKHHRDYIQTYIERDVRNLLNVKDLTLFQHFLKLVASRIGQLINTQGLGQELGLSNHTIKQWLSVLETSFIIQRLEPYYQNFGKRVIKSPKLYFVDVGLASFLLDIETPLQMARDPLRGSLFENLVMMDLYKTQLHQGRSTPFYFYRDSNQKEIDCLYKKAGDLLPIEIKSSLTFSPNFFKNIKYFNILTKTNTPKGYVIYPGDMEITATSYELLNYKNAWKILS
jgi:predicted AAA+ superfamily ATPase